MRKRSDEPSKLIPRALDPHPRQAPAPADRPTEMLDLTTKFDPMLRIFAVPFSLVVVGRQSNVPPPHIAPSARPLALPPPLILLPGAFTPT